MQHFQVELLKKDNAITPVFYEFYSAKHKDNKKVDVHRCVRDNIALMRKRLYAAEVKVRPRYFCLLF